MGPACTLKIVEVFGGSRCVVKAFQAAGKEASQFDVRLDGMQNIHMASGFESLLGLLVRVEPSHGTVIIEPTSGSWVWRDFSKNARRDSIR